MKARAQLGFWEVVISGVKLPFKKLTDKPQRAGFAEEQIDQAMERGDFENLRGQGKPLVLSGDLADQKAMRAKIRGDAGWGAPWQEVAREIEVATARARASARRAHEFYLAGLRSKRAQKAKIEADFALARRGVVEQIAQVNSLILKYNLLIPPLLPHLHRVRLTEIEVWREIAPDILRDDTRQF